MGEIFSNPNEDNRYTFLNEWIDKATDGLCFAAKERIREELVDHYDQALEELENSGFEWLRLRIAAVEQLGDPAEANVRYKLEFITEDDEHAINQLYVTKISVFLYLGMFFILSAMILTPVKDWIWSSICAILLPLGQSVKFPGIGRFGIRRAMIFRSAWTSLMLSLIVSYLVGQWILPLLLGIAMFIWDWNGTINPFLNKLEANGYDFDDRGKA
jgi:hypothetical protein